MPADRNLQSLWIHSQPTEDVKIAAEKKQPTKNQEPQTQVRDERQSVNDHFPNIPGFPHRHLHICHPHTPISPQVIPPSLPQCLSAQMGKELEYAAIQQ